MFLRRSRYYELETVDAVDPGGRQVKAVKLRRLPATPGAPVLVRDGDQLDVMSQRRYKDPTRFWHIGDAASELEVNELVRTAGRIIDVPES